MSKITINGVTFYGNSVVVSNGKVLVDGKSSGSTDAKQINIHIEGNINSLDVDFCERISVKGDVNTLHSTSGDIKVEGNVTNGVSSTSGDIECHDVGGNVTSTSGDVDCHDVKGSVKTISGDIKHRRT